MKKSRTQILPLLLLSVILLAGYFSPTLFSLISPDFKNNVEDVKITSAESPLYLENTDHLILPPWDRIDTRTTTAFRETYPERIHIDFLADFNVRVNHWISTLYPEAKPETNVLYSGMIDNIRVTKNRSSTDSYHTTYLFVQDYRYTAVDHHIYLLDMVIDENGWAPLYLHIQREDRETAPAKHADFLQTDFHRVLATLQNLDMHWILEQDDGTTEEMIRNVMTYTLLSIPGTNHAPQLLQALATQLIPPDVIEKPESNMTYASAALLETIFNYWNIYTMTYDDETLLVLSDDQNRTYCLFYDAVSNRVTGFSVDAKPADEPTDMAEIFK